MPTAYYIPNGPKNLESLFPTLDFDDIEEYNVQVIDSLGAVVATSTQNIIESCPEDLVRIHFLNYLGTIDAINFKLKTKENESKSDTHEKPATYPLDIAVHALGRFNVKSNKTYRAVSTKYTETEMDWLDELLDSPLSWIEWTGIEGQADGYLPIVILDGKQADQKEEDRYTYEVYVEFVLSHDKFIIRN